MSSAQSSALMGYFIRHSGVSSKITEHVNSDSGKTVLPGFLATEAGGAVKLLTTASNMATELTKTARSEPSAILSVQNPVMLVDDEYALIPTLDRITGRLKCDLVQWTHTRPAPGLQWPSPYEPVTIGGVNGVTRDSLGGSAYQLACHLLESGSVLQESTRFRLEDALDSAAREAGCTLKCTRLVSGTGWESLENASAADSSNATDRGLRPGPHDLRTDPYPDLPANGRFPSYVLTAKFDIGKPAQSALQSWVTIDLEPGDSSRDLFRSKTISATGKRAMSWTAACPPAVADFIQDRLAWMLTLQLTTTRGVEPSKRGHGDRLKNAMLFLKSGARNKQTAVSSHSPADGQASALSVQVDKDGRRRLHDTQDIDGRAEMIDCETLVDPKHRTLSFHIRYYNPQHHAEISNPTPPQLPGV